MTSLPDRPPDRWIAIARLLRPQGRRGELLAEPLTDLPGLFVPGRELRLATPDGVPVVLQDAWRPQGRNAGRIVLKLAGTDSISAAEALEGTDLLAPESALPALDPDTYMVRDLIGCALFDGDHLLGTITEIQFPVGPDGRTRLQDAPDLLAIHPPNAPEDTDLTLVPFVKSWLRSINLPQKQIHMHLPPGLIEATDGQPTIPNPHDAP